MVTRKPAANVLHLKYRYTTSPNESYSVCGDEELMFNVSKSLYICLYKTYTFLITHNTVPWVTRDFIVLTYVAHAALMFKVGLVVFLREHTFDVNLFFIYSFWPHLPIFRNHSLAHIKLKGHNVWRSFITGLLNRLCLSSGCRGNHMPRTHRHCTDVLYFFLFRRMVNLNVLNAFLNQYYRHFRDVLHVLIYAEP